MWSWHAWINRSILNALGFRAGDESLLLPDVSNEQMEKKLELGYDQIELVLQLLQKGKKMNVYKCYD